jgi:hypothetical protein
MTKTEQLQNLEIKNEIKIEQYKNGIFDKVLILYRKSLSRILRIFRSEANQRLTIRDRARIKGLIRQELSELRQQFENLTKKEMDQLIPVLAKMEIDTVNKVQKSDYVAPVLSSYLNTNVLAEKGTVLSISGMTEIAFLSYQRQLFMLVDRMSVFPEDSETLNDFYNTISFRTQNSLNAVTLTSVAIVASLIKRAFVRSNTNTMSGYQWISVLDGKTTEYCQIRHLRFWIFGDKESSTLTSEEYPPGHYRCRSGIVYIFKGDAPVQTPTYSEWFEQQDESTKKDILGVNRYEMYKIGAIEVDMISTISGRRLTLQELNQM